MITLTNISSNKTQLLTVTLGGSATTTYPTCTVNSYIVLRQAKVIYGANGAVAADTSEYSRACEFTLLTTASKTTIAVAPISGQSKNLEYICIYNADTVAATVTIAIDDNGTSRIQVKQTLQPNESLIYDGAGFGWHII